MHSIISRASSGRIAPQAFGRTLKFLFLLFLKGENSANPIFAEERETVYSHDGVAFPVVDSREKSKETTQKESDSSTFEGRRQRALEKKRLRRQPQQEQQQQLNGFAEMCWDDVACSVVDDVVLSSIEEGEQNHLRFEQMRKKKQLRRRKRAQERLSSISTNVSH